MPSSSFLAKLLENEVLGIQQSCEIILFQKSKRILLDQQNSFVRPAGYSCYINRTFLLE